MQMLVARDSAEEVQLNLRYQLDRWINQCPLCYLRREPKKIHRLQDCPRGEARQIITNWDRMRAGIQFAKRDHCFRCGLKDRPWESDAHCPWYKTWNGFNPGEWSCRYEGVVMSVIMTILQECGRDWVLRDFYRWLEQEDVNYRDEELFYKWLGQVSDYGAYSGMAGLHKAFL